MGARVVMLSTLRIQNIAIIDSLEIEFSKGLNVLTGETGAGKSIILKSIELLQGKKANSGLLRTGTDKAFIEGLFILNKATKDTLTNLSEELSDLIDSDELVVKRVIDANGRSKFYLNSSLSTAGLVGQLMETLISMTGQHEQKTLLSGSNYRIILDSFGVNKQILNETKEAFHLWKKETDLLEDLKNRREILEARIFRLTAEKEELSKLKLKSGERDDLEAEVLKLQSGDKIKQCLDECMDALEGGSPGTSLLDKFGKLSLRLEQALRYDTSLQPTFDLLESTRTELDEIRININDYASSIDHDERKFDKLQERLTEIMRLERKYQKSADELVIHFDKICEELAQFEGGAFDEKLIEAKIIKYKEALLKKETTLREERKKVAKKLEKAVLAGLKEVGLIKAQFEVTVDAYLSSSHGADKIEFMFTANPGEKKRALNEVASGGEISRVLLVLKSVSPTAQDALLQVYDEIDVGVSGHIAEVVGEKLKAISKIGQVLAITHSAQVASLADTHILIEKEINSGRTFSRAKLLEKEERLQAVASMLAGKDVSEEFIESAKKLLSR